MACDKPSVSITSVQVSIHVPVRVIAGQMKLNEAIASLQRVLSPVPNVPFLGDANTHGLAAVMSDVDIRLNTPVLFVGDQLVKCGFIGMEPSTYGVLAVFKGYMGPFEIDEASMKSDHWIVVSCDYRMQSELMGHDR